MKAKKVIQVFLLFCLIAFASYNSYANDITLSNFSLTGQNSTNHSTMVKFDIAWENSFRMNSGPSNWDAAWVFVKYRIGTGEWQPAWLNNTGHFNPAGSVISTGLLDPALPFNAVTNPGLGVFIYRDADGTGTFSKTGVQLRWNYGANGVPDNETVQIQVFAIEMVYVPQGSFYVGSGGTESGAFYKYPVTTDAYQITSEGAITVGTASDNLYYPSTTFGGDQNGPIPSAFPKGFNSFYCMKYEISQQGYVDFLNSLSGAQAVIRYPNEFGNARYAISVSGGVYSTTNPYVACNHLGWADLSAYLDWSGLRPMTELEFEKSCRGNQSTVPNEYAWGSTFIIQNTGITNPGANNEISSTPGANCTYNNGVPGPMRVGAFATISSTRVSSGATYYGIMEMSGNTWERSVTVGNSIGRGFTGAHGNGLLDVSGNADVLLWPGANSDGSGFRGGIWSDPFPAYLLVSDRTYAAETWPNRHSSCGGRGVRSVQ